MRKGVDIDTVIKMTAMMTNLIGEQAKVMIRDNPNIQIDDFDPVMAQVMKYMRVLEYGFLDPEANHD
jgi:hypothetical protein